jgi:hypothetical protein
MVGSRIMLQGTRVQLRGCVALCYDLTNKLAPSHDAFACCWAFHGDGDRGEMSFHHGASYRAAAGAQLNSCCRIFKAAHAIHV